MKTRLWKACFAALALCAAATVESSPTSGYCCSPLHCCGAIVQTTDCFAAGGTMYGTRAVCLRSCDLESCGI